MAESLTQSRFMQQAVGERITRKLPLLGDLLSINVSLTTERLRSTDICI